MHPQKNAKAAVAAEAAHAMVAADMAAVLELEAAAVMVVALVVHNLVAVLIGRAISKNVKMVSIIVMAATEMEAAAVIPLQAVMADSEVNVQPVLAMRALLMHATLAIVLMLMMA